MRPLLAAVFALSVLPTTPAVAQSGGARAIESAIAEVTVYPDRAQVTRVAHLDLTPGTYTLRFDKLPTGILADSVRVRGRGTADATVEGFEFQTAYLGRSPQAGVQALETKLQALDDQDRVLSDQHGIHERQLQLLKNTTGLSGEGLAKGLATGKTHVQDWQALVNFLETQQEKETQALRTLDIQRRALAIKRTALQFQLTKLRGMTPVETRRVPVTIDVRQGGTLDLSLDYVLENASWAPSYDARLDPAGSKLDWRYYAVVSQQTGESWQNVKLRLSTAQPAVGANPPEIPDWFLQPYVPQPMAEDAAAPAPAAPPALQARGAMPKHERREANEAQATVSNQGSSVTLDVVRPVTIPADGEPHTAPIGAASFPAKTAYVVYPKLSNAAFLDLSAKHTGPWPLLPGTIKAFVGQDYVGSMALTTDFSPGETLKLRMGADRAIKVERKRLAKTEGVSGLLRKSNFADYRYTVAIINGKPAAQTIRVVEPIPQTTQENVRVFTEAMSQQPTSSQTPGQLEWVFKVAPGQKKTLNWGYKVEYPLDMRLTGLE